MQTIVIGHKNPDMDSICSALAYAHLKQVQGMQNVIAGRAGNTNERIDYILKKFGVKAPVFIADMAPTVKDVMEKSVLSVHENDPVSDAINIMGTRRLRGLPVIDDEGGLLGLLSTFQITQYLFPLHGKGSQLRYVTTSVEMIAKAVGGSILAGEASKDAEELILVIGAMAPTTFAERIRKYNPKQMVVLVGDRYGIQREAVRNGAHALCVTGGNSVSPDIIEEAQERGVCVFTSPNDTATTVLMARGAASAGRMIEDHFTSFYPDTSLAAARHEAATSGGFVFPIIDEHHRLVGILSKSDFLKTVARQLILVDHNELSQAVTGAEDVPIIEILDHHRIGGLATQSPILFWNNPVGSTSTIVALCYEQARIEIPAPMAGLLMAGLISDTLNLTSPTATPTDKRILAMLAERAQYDPTKLAEEIFSVGSPLLTMTPDEAVSADCKTYEENGVRFTVSQIEELSLERFEQKEAALLEALKTLQKQNDAFFSALLVTDVNTQNSLLLVAGDETFRLCIDFPERGPNLWELDRIVSRKKQLLPYLTKKLAGARAKKKA